MIARWIARILKWMLAVLLAPLVVTATRSFTELLASTDVAVPQRLVALIEGIGLYLVVHLAVWKPKPFYLLGHRVLQHLLNGVMGGHVRAMPAGPQEVFGASASAPAARSAPVTDGKEFVLAAVSPALVPIYTLLAAVGVGVVRATAVWPVSEAVLLRIIGASAAFHLLMALDTLQETRRQQMFAGYLVTVELVYLATLGVTLMCLALLLGDVSLRDIVQQTVRDTFAIYAALYQQLFR